MLCRVWGPHHTGDPAVKRIAQIFKRSLSVRYDGYSDEFDQQFHDRSVWLELVGDTEDKPLATCRLIHRAHGSAAGLLPMQMGDVSASALGKGLRIVEGSGFWYLEPIHGITMFDCVMSYLIRDNVDLGYVLYDMSNEVTRSLYLDLLGLEPVPSEKVIFSSFRRRKTLEPVVWHVAKGDQSIFQTARRRLERAGAPPTRFWG